jgi:hypothetical protein
MPRLDSILEDRIRKIVDSTDICVPELKIVFPYSGDVLVIITCVYDHETFRILNVQSSGKILTASFPNATGRDNICEHPDLAAAVEELRYWCSFLEYAFRG